MHLDFPASLCSLRIETERVQQEQRKVSGPGGLTWYSYVVMTPLTPFISPSDQVAGSPAAATWLQPEEARVWWY